MAKKKWYKALGFHWLAWGLIKTLRVVDRKDKCEEFGEELLNIGKGSFNVRDLLSIKSILANIWYDVLRGIYKGDKEGLQDKMNMWHKLNGGI